MLIQKAHEQSIYSGISLTLTHLLTQHKTL